jgi:quinol monooxygenase YgiN
MCIRFVTVKALPDKVEEVRDFFRTQVFVRLQETEGCLFASLGESTSDPNEFIRMSRRMPVDDWL